ncbi:MAG: ribosome recycling factor [Patescibacteria group bacterium]|jgi:ribosome recycling factor
MSIIDDHKNEFIKVVDHFKTELGQLKTGRANPAILDGVRVQNYGTLMPLNQVASVTIGDSRSLLIQPWDKSIVKDIEKAILESNLNLSPSNEGERIRISLPVMTEETRRDTVKLLHQKAEQAKITIRLERDQVKGKIEAAEEDKEFGEDERFRLLEELDKTVGKYNEEVKGLVEKKEEEIMTV